MLGRYLQALAAGPLAVLTTMVGVEVGVRQELGEGIRIRSRGRSRIRCRTNSRSKSRTRSKSMSRSLN